MDFREWLFRGRDERTAADYVRYFERLGLEACRCSFSCILEVARRARNSWEKKLVRLYARFCWEEGSITYDELMRVRAAARFSSGGFSPRKKVDIRLERLRVPQWLNPYVELLFYSGARLSEVHKVVGGRYEPVFFGDYGDYAYVELLLFRGAKRVYAVFAPRRVMIEALRAEPHPYKSVAFALHRRGLHARDFRRFFFQRCTFVAPSMICDFYQGRVKTVSARHYEALLEKAVTFYPFVVEALEEMSWRVLRARLLLFLLRKHDDRFGFGVED